MAKLILAGETTATMAQSPFKMTNLGIVAASLAQGKPFTAEDLIPASRWSPKTTPTSSGLLAVDHRGTGRSALQAC